MIYRHGDIILRPAKKQEGLKFIGRFKSFVLALGEHTGNKHLLTSCPTTEFEVYQDKGGNYFLNLSGGGKLTHEEHKSIEVMPDFYVVGNEKEYNYWEQETQKVQD